MFFFKNNPENEARGLVPHSILFFKNALHEVKASGHQLSFNIFRQSSTSHTIKKTVSNF